MVVRRGSAHDGGFVLAILALALLAGCTDPKKPGAPTGHGALIPSTTPPATCGPFAGGTAPSFRTARRTASLDGEGVGLTSDCRDGVTFYFRGRPSGWQVSYQNPPFVSRTSGPVKVSGAAFLLIRLTPAKPAPAAKDSMGNLAEAIVPGQPMFVFQLQLLSGSGGTITYVAGLDRKRPYRVTTAAHPSRLVITIGS